MHAGYAGIVAPLHPAAHVRYHQRRFFGHRDVGGPGGEQPHASPRFWRTVGGGVGGEHFGVPPVVEGKAGDRLAGRGRFRAFPGEGQTQPLCPGGLQPAHEGQPAIGQEAPHDHFQVLVALARGVDHFRHALPQVAVDVQAGELAQLRHLQQPQLLHRIFQTQVARHQGFQEAAEVMTVSVVAGVAHSLYTFRALPEQTAARASGPSSPRPSK